jgi:hypothetical protein
MTSLDLPRNKRAEYDKEIKDLGIDPTKVLENAKATAKGLKKTKLEGEGKSQNWTPKLLSEMMGEVSDDGSNCDQLIRRGTINAKLSESKELARTGTWDEAIKKLDGIGLTKDERSQFPEVSREKSMYEKAKTIETKLTSASLKNINPLKKDIDGLNIDDDARKRLKGLHKTKEITLLRAEIANLEETKPSFWNSKESIEKKKRKSTRKVKSFRYRYRR